MGRNALLWIIIGLAATFMFSSFNTDTKRNPSTELPYTVFLKQVDEGRVADLTLNNDNSAVGSLS